MKKNVLSCPSLDSVGEFIEAGNIRWQVGKKTAPIGPLLETVTVTLQPAAQALGSPPQPKGKGKGEESQGATPSTLHSINEL